MFSTINTNRVRSAIVVKSAAAAAVALASIGLTSVAKASPASVTAISTTYTAGSPLIAPNVPGSAQSKVYSSSSKYNLTYDGGDLAITTVSTSSTTYIAQTAGTTYVRRNDAPSSQTSNPDTELLSYQATGGLSGPNLELLGPQQTGYSQAYGGNNLLVGADNIFTNTGDPNQDNTNVERVDAVDFAGMTAGNNIAFSIFDRSTGATDAHDGFQIVAITGVDATGTPTSYGSSVDVVSTGSYGQNALIAPAEYVVVQKNLANGSSSPFEPAANHTDATFGGVVIPSTDLAPAGTTIYGYSIFALDVNTSNEANLLNWDSSAYPVNTNPTEGGLDPLATENVILTAVPEPGSLALLAGAGVLALRRRRATA